MFDALEGGIELVADGLRTGAEFDRYFSDGQVFDPVHVKDFLHAFGKPVNRQHELLFGFFEVELFVGGVCVVVVGYLLEGIDMFLIKVFIAHSVEEAVFEGGAEVGEDGGNCREGGVFFPEVYEHTLDRVLCGGRIAGDSAGVGEEVLPVQLEELTESVFIT